MSMIRQLRVTVKTAAATLTYGEMGDVIVNSADAVTVTLPTPAKGLWYRFSNVGAGVLTIAYDSATITTLNQYEQALVLAYDASAWWMSKGGSLTKSSVEAVLTGEITSHTHPYSDEVLSGTSAPTTATEGALGQFYMETTTPALYQCTAIGGGAYTWTEIGAGSGGASAFTELSDVPSSYSGMAGKYIRVNSSEAALEFATPAGASPLTTKGDIRVYGTADDRLPIGANDYVLTADSAQALGMKWAAPSGSAAVSVWGDM